MFRTVSYRINEEKNGIELKYGYLPSIDIRDKLKKQGWKWNPKGEVWYIRYSEEALNFAKKQARKTMERQLEIDKMPVFYKKHCGCEESYLPLLEENIFYKYVKTGSLKSISKELLYEYVYDDALSLLKELYIQSIKNEKYRNELISKTNNDAFYIRGDGSITLKSYYQSNCDTIDNKLGVQQGSFWRNLEIFGIDLQPVDRIAYWVSNYRSSCIENHINYYSASSIQERYLFSIISQLTLDYDDTLVKIIKEHLEKELEYILRQSTPNFYLLSLYALILNDKKQADEFLVKYIDEITPNQVILNIEQIRINNNCKNIN